MTKMKTLRPSVSSAALTTGLAMSLSAIPLADALAQQAASAHAPVPATEEELPTVTVAGENAPANALEATTGLARLPGTVQDTPQTITVISQEMMQQQGVTTHVQQRPPHLAPHMQAPHVSQSSDGTPASELSVAAHHMLLPSFVPFHPRSLQSSPSMTRHPMANRCQPLSNLV